MDYGYRFWCALCGEEITKNYHGVRDEEDRLVHRECQQEQCQPRVPAAAVGEEEGR